MKDFIAKPELLEEEISQEDHFNLSDHITSISQKIDQIKGSSMIGIVAEYGRGKSTLIKQVQNSRKEHKETWVDFEAWKVPGRKELWETFVIDLARQINKKEFNEAIAKLDGKQNDDKKTLINTIGDIPIPGFSSIKNLNHFFNTSPARRVFEIQEILKNIVEKFPENRLIIVVEDVDRSGENGIYFIETLKQFIRDIQTKKQIIVILPISQTSFYQKEESYLKCLDVIEFFEYKEHKYENFLRKVFSEEIEEIDIKRVSDLFILLSREYPGTTMRKIKLILRKANIINNILHEEGYDPDWRVCVAIEAARFLKKDGEEKSALDDFISKKIINKSSVFAQYLWLLSQKSPLIMTSGQGEKISPLSPHPFKFFKRPGNTVEYIRTYPSTPYMPGHSFPGDEDYKGIVLDFYIKH